MRPNRRPRPTPARWPRALLRYTGPCVLAGIAGIVLLNLSVAPAWADEVAPVACLSDPDVLHGDVEDYTSGACVDVNECFDVIAAWIEIKERGLDEEDAEYYVLLAKANLAFYTALESVIDADKYDLVMRHDAALAKEEGFPNITDAVIEVLQAN